MNTPPAGKLAITLLLMGPCLFWSQSPPAERGQTPVAAGYVRKQAISGKELAGNLRGWRFSLWQPSAQHSALPAKLCAVRAQSKSQDQELCYDARVGSEIFSQDALAEPLVIHSRTPLRQTILLRAKSFGGGSGWGILVALLVPDKPNERLRNLLPDVVISNQGESTFWDQRKFSDYRLFAVADIVTNESETHFASHYYMIRTFAYCQKRDSYVLADEYTTSKKYGGLDETDKIQVLGLEQATIEKRILRLKRIETSCSASPRR
jgi:hypothetical protein